MRFLLGPLGWIPQSSKKYFVCAWLPMFSCQKGGQKSKPFATLMLTSSQCFTKSIFLKFFYMLNITAVKISADILLKILQDRLEQYVNREPPDIQAGFRKGRGTRDQMSNICWIIKKSKRVPKKTSTSALLTLSKSLTVWITTNCRKFFKRWEYQTTRPASWEIWVQVRKHPDLELDMEQQTSSK